MSRCQVGPLENNKSLVRLTHYKYVIVFNLSNYHINFFFHMKSYKDPIVE